jgi:hypothetical protein
MQLDREQLPLYFQELYLEAIPGTQFGKVFQDITVEPGDVDDGLELGEDSERGLSDCC